jgi:hypothetical protein
LRAHAPARHRGRAAHRLDRLNAKTKRGLAFLISALIALFLIRALMLAQPPAQSAETSKATLAQATNAPATAPLSIGQKVVVVTMANWVSCKAFDDTKRFSELIRSADMVAVSHFIAIEEPTGDRASASSATP